MAQRDRTVDDIAREGERIRKELENQIAAKSVDLDNAKRALEEIQYEAENLRRAINSK